MKRRKWLKTVGALGIGALAGCTGSGESNPTTTHTTITSTTTQQTPTEPTNQPTTTERPVPPESRTFIEEPAVFTEKEFSVQPRQWTVRSSVPYYNDNTDGVLTLNASDHFLSFQIEVYNRGDELIEPPDYNKFSLWVGGMEFNQVKELPNGVEWSQLRQGDLDYQLSQPWWTEDFPWSGRIHADSSALPAFLFHGNIPDRKYYLKWNPTWVEDPFYFGFEDD